jgi:NitT/TauT family transport system substrate-binding protein
MAVRSSTLRTVAWMGALAVALALVGLAYARSGDTGEVVTPASPAPGVPDDPGDGCGEAASTDPANLGVDRTIARCGAGAPAARPLRRAATVRVAIPERTEAMAPLLLADALDEFEAENLTVEIVELDLAEAYAAMADGEVDVVVGGIDAPFFDAVHDGVGARLVLGGAVARRPSDLASPQTGLWLRADLINEDGEWDNVEGTTVLVTGGLGSAALYPIDNTLGQEELNANSIDFASVTSEAAAARLRAAVVGGAWLPEPEATAVAEDPALIQVTTLPGSESIDGTVFSRRLMRQDRAVGLAYARAVIRTINTYLADGYDDAAVTALAEALDVPESAVTAGPAPLFDWELRSGTTIRIQDSLVMVGAVGYERPTGESRLVDRTIYADVVAEDAGGEGDDAGAAGEGAG